MKDTVELGPGTRLGASYEVVRQIGAGGMGAVYEAKHVRLGHRVAVKVLLDDVGESDESWNRFRREAEIGARLGHPNIVHVSDWDKLPSGAPFLVMEFLDGEDLAHRLRRGPLPMETAKRLLKEIGAALAAAHRQGIVHRDLKPQNVFLVPVEESEGLVEHVKLLDFGISKIHASRTVVTGDNALLGTPQYMAPEQAQGRSSDIDARTDQFALAAIAYEMLAGRPAFSAESVTAVLYRVVYEDPTPLADVVPGLPAHVVEAVGRGLAKERADRFADVTSFVQAFTGEARKPATTGAWTGDRGKHDEDAFAPTERAATTQRNGRRLFAPLAVAGIVGLGLGAMLFVTMRHHPPAPPPVEKKAVQGVAAMPIPRPVEVTEAIPIPTPLAPTRATPVPTAAAPVVQREKPHRVAAPESPDAKSRLDEAQALYDRGDFAGAIARARQAIPLGDPPRGRLLIVKATCSMKDLGGANAALAALPSGQRATAKALCRKLGLDL